MRRHRTETILAEPTAYPELRVLPSGKQSWHQTNRTSIRHQNQSLSPAHCPVFRFDSTNRLEINQKVAATAVYRRIRRAVLVEGRSQRSVAREFGLARVTVRKMLG